MNQIMPILESGKPDPQYIQLFTYIRNQILGGGIASGEKLPSLRSLAKALEISLTTVGLAYDQLLVEGYISSKRGSGYYVNEIASGMGTPPTRHFMSAEEELSRENPFFHDPATFDFAKWKKCTNQVLTEYAHLLFHEGDPQGEPALRNEIAKYVYQSRGVLCTPSQIVIGAGTQQITGQLSNILNQLKIDNVALEDPCYLPVKNIFRDRGFELHQVPVGKNGISISHLPRNNRAAVYVNPSNQFPTGAVIPIGKRYDLLAWAEKNDSIIIEDDYDSELRYFGRPIPALQGLDTDERVVYLGSFSSTLYPSVKISYMILPEFMANIFQKQKSDYTQTCSKVEQLALSIYMKKGQYQTGIKKLRALCSQKLQIVTYIFTRHASDFITLSNTGSGVNIILTLQSQRSPDQLCEMGASLGVHLSKVSSYTDTINQGGSNQPSLILYFNQIPLDEIASALQELIILWRDDKVNGAPGVSKKA